MTRQRLEVPRGHQAGGADRHLVQPVFIAIAKPVFDKLTPAQQVRAARRLARPADMQIAKTLADEGRHRHSQAANIRISEPDAGAFRSVVFRQSTSRPA